MLHITIPKTELYDEKANEFFTVNSQRITMEHSLVSVSKWESRWLKPFFSRFEKTNEEAMDYIRCMTITQNVNPIVFRALTGENVRKIFEYIDNPMVALTYTNQEDNTKINNEPITAELIYYWMFTLNVPIECQKWHINKLLTLIRIFNIKNKPVKKRSQQELVSMYSRINEENKRKIEQMKGKNHD